MTAASSAFARSTLLCLVACSILACERSEEQLLPTARVHVAVSVDWEGAYLSEAGLDAIAQFRESHPSVPLTHFLNAAYFSKYGESGVETARRIRSVIAKQDELGLHLHAWASLAEAAGVTPKLEPVFLGAEPMRFDDGDVGFDVDLAAYSVEELRALLAISRKTLEARELEVGPAFRAAAWLGHPTILEAAAAEGFTVDSSAVDPRWLDEQASTPLPARLRKLWPDGTSATQPYWISTPAGSLLEMPDTGALADYLTAEEMTDHICGAVSHWLGEPHRDIFVQVGFHQENAEEFAPRVSAAVTAANQRCGAALAFETLSASASAARTQLGPSMEVARR